MSKEPGNLDEYNGCPITTFTLYKGLRRYGWQTPPSPPTPLVETALLAHQAAEFTRAVSGNPLED